MRKIILFLFVNTLIITNIEAQKNITGCLVDNNTKQPVDFAMVALIKSNDSTFIAYGLSEENGCFDLDIKDTSLIKTTDTLLLSISKIGIMQKNIIIPYSNVGYQLALGNILIEQNPTLLQEVVINAKTPSIIEKNDTTVFNASHFKNGTESKIEDLLAKIPGIKVKDNGRLFYQDKEIEKVLIEGDDMFGANYTIGTKNISATVVDKVQVIDNYLDNPLFKELIKSNKTVINIGVNEKFKNSFSENIEIGIGKSMDKEVKNTLGSISIALFKKYKSVLIASTNNTRNDLSGEVEPYYENNGFSTNRIKVINEKASYLLQNNTLPTVGNLGEVFFVKGQQHLLSSSNIIKINPRAKLRVLGTSLRRYNITKEDNSYRFFNNSDTLAFFDFIQNASCNTSLKMNLDFEYVAVSKGISIKTNSQMLQNRDFYSAKIIRNNNQNILSTHNFSPGGIINSIEITKKIKLNIFQIVSEQVLHHQKEVGQYDNQNINQYFQNNLGHIAQDLTSTLNGFNIYMRYMKRNAKINTDLVLGVSYKNQYIDNNNNLISLIDDSTKYIRLTNDIFSSIKLYKYFNKTDFSLSILIKKSNVNQKLIADSDDNNKLFFLAEPSIEIKRVLKHQWKTAINATLQQNLTDIGTSIESLIFKDYQTLYIGNNKIFKQSDFVTKFMLNKSNMVKGYSFSIFLSNSKRVNPFGNNIQFNDLLFVDKFYLQKTNRSNNINTNASYIISKLKSRISISNNISFVQGDNIINQVTRVIETISKSTSLDYGTAFNLVNFRGKYTIYHQKIKFKDQQPSLYVINNILELSCNGKINKHLFVDYIFNYFNTKVINSNKYFCDNLNLTYKFVPNKDYNIKLSVYNLFNKSSFTTRNASNYFFTQNNIYATKRFILLIFNYGF